MRESTERKKKERYPQWCKMNVRIEIEFRHQAFMLKTLITQDSKGKKKKKCHVPSKI